MASSNTTTIENLSRHNAVWTLAVRVPEHLLERLWAPDYPWAPTFRMVSYPPQQVPSSDPQPDVTNIPTGERHVFAILHTQPGENPFDLGSPIKNLQQVMGYSVIDWLLPIKPSPCTDHSSKESHYAMGPVVTRLRQEAGLLVAPPENGAYSKLSHSGRSHRENSPSNQ
jgi:palmitoyltransferase